MFLGDGRSQLGSNCIYFMNAGGLRFVSNGDIRAAMHRSELVGYRKGRRVASCARMVVAGVLVVAVVAQASPGLGQEASADEAQSESRNEDAETDAPAAESATADSKEEIDTILIVGSAVDDSVRANRGLLAGSFDVTTREELQWEHPNDTLELFSKTPGVSLSRYNQGIINTDVAIRGFAGDGTTPHAKLLIDGIPSHLHNGYGELDQLFPLGIGSIEVFKGTSDVRQGRFNTAGNYYVASRSDEGTELQATYGSFDSFEIQAYSGIKLDRFSQSLFAGYRRTDGFRDHSETDKYSVSGRWSLDLNESADLTFVARLSGYEGDSPGYLSREESREDPTSSAPFANQDGGEKEIRHFSLHFSQGFLDESLQLGAKVYRQTFERQRWVRFSEAGSLSERFDDQVQTGLVSTLTWAPLETLTVAAGFDVQVEDVIEQRFGTIGQTRQRDTSNVIRNFDYNLDTYGGFVSVENQLFDRIRWSAGLRIDYLAGDFTSTDVEGNSADADIIDFGVILQPKVNVLVEIIDGLAVFANYGRTFQSPFGAALYAVEGATRSQEVSINDGWEAGARWSPGLGLSLRLSYWQQLASNEFVSVDGENQNVGETDRTGIEAALTWYLLEELYFWGNFSWTMTEIANPGDTAPDTVGNRLRSVPDFTTSFGARYDITRNFFAAVHFDGQGSYYVNESNLGGRFGDYLIGHINAGFQTDTDRIELQVNNIFDSFYEYVFDFSSDGTATIHSPGAGVNANITYTRTF